VEILSDGACLYVITGTGNIWKSIDSGTTWLPVGMLSQVHTSGMVLGRSGALFAVTREGEVASSPDGVNWTWVGAINQLNVVALGSDLPVTGIPEVDGRSASLLVGAPWPNPVATRTQALTFPLTLARAGQVAVELVDVRGGRVVSRAPEAIATPGRHIVVWEPGTLASGIYFARVTLDGQAQTRKLVVGN
jgi:hypothetical protein